MNTVFLLLVICLFIFAIFKMCTPKSSFGGSGSGDKNVYIFYSESCGHCIRAMPEFELAKKSSDKIKLINVKEPGNKKLLEQYDDKIQGVPTIVRASDGAVYNGDRKAYLISQFAD